MHHVPILRLTRRLCTPNVVSTLHTIVACPHASFHSLFTSHTSLSALTNASPPVAHLMHAHCLSCTLTAPCVPTPRLVRSLHPVRRHSPLHHLYFSHTITDLYRPSHALFALCAPSSSPVRRQHPSRALTAPHTLLSLARLSRPLHTISNPSRVVPAPQTPFRPLRALVRFSYVPSTPHTRSPLFMNSSCIIAPYIRRPRPLRALISSPLIYRFYFLVHIDFI
jgi:hypothetical protein